ncbi:MAG: DNA polymerase III subunit gamma/tau, partial [Bacteroidota bacterium]
MENYIVSARKYRPSTFASVVGQSHVTNTLKSAILRSQLAHAFLFSGPRGVGKTTCARILAKAINCENLTPEGEPCNKCDSCLAFNSGKNINIHELDAASNNRVEDIRNLIEQTRYVPAPGKSGQPARSVYIIDEVHMLSQAAFNAFLKTLEEPPPHVLFILATTEKHKILPTILSRCQKHDFRRIKVEDISQHLAHISDQEKVQYEKSALQQIALKADGALRDALSLYDQLVSYGGGSLSFDAVLEHLNILDYDYYFRTVELMQAHNHHELFLLLNSVIEKGFEAKEFIVGLNEHFRNLLVCQSPDTLKLLEASENVQERYRRQGQALDPTLLLNAFHLCSEAERQCRNAATPRLTVELCLVKLAHLEQAIQVTEDPSKSEKKKSLSKASEKKALKEPHTKDEIATDEKSQKEVLKKENIQEEVAPEPIVASEPTPNGSLTSRLKSLQSVKAAMQEANAARVEETPAETHHKQEINPSIDLIEEQVKLAINEYTEILRNQGKFGLAAALDDFPATIEHNCIRFAVPQTAGTMLERDQELLPYLKQKMSCPDIFLEVTEQEQIQQNTP